MGFAADFHRTRPLGTGRCSQTGATRSCEAIRAVMDRPAMSRSKIFVFITLFGYQRTTTADVDGSMILHDDERFLVELERCDRFTMNRDTRSATVAEPHDQ